MSSCIFNLIATEESKKFSLSIKILRKLIYDPEIFFSCSEIYSDWTQKMIFSQNRLQSSWLEGKDYVRLRFIKVNREDYFNSVATESRFQSFMPLRAIEELLLISWKYHSCLIYWLKINFIITPAACNWRNSFAPPLC